MRIFKGRISRILAAALLAAAPVASAAQDLAMEESLPEELTETIADRLDPGDYRWQPERGAEGELAVIVSLSRQMAYVYRGGALIGVSTVSTGKPGHETPTGSFRITQKKVHHISNLYYAPMPFMQRLTDDGIALHAGQIPGYPASHGCIRLPAAFAKALFGETKIGMTVTIQEEDQLGAPMDIADVETIGPDPELRMASGYSENAVAR